MNPAYREALGDGRAAARVAAGSVPLPARAALAARTARTARTGGFIPLPSRGGRA
ncbi:hypothetical protein OG311_35005 [Streptomyces sp. NBC_01343]|uniref:hypothetical protein n=1 Tax=Streptomyces sp. NBC_01343 TaxID=2903832 RepID=UPI002E10437C|nr:hypothetical protein OG311_35005 [Streptomyces sp. NBC_01343]